MMSCFIVNRKMQVKVNGDPVRLPGAFLNKQQQVCKMMLGLLEKQLYMLQEGNNTAFRGNDLTKDIFFSLKIEEDKQERDEQNGLLKIMTYLEQKGHLTEMLRVLETSEAKIEHLAESRTLSEDEKDEKRRIILKLKVYFENGETFQGINKMQEFKQLVQLKQNRLESVEKIEESRKPHRRPVIPQDLKPGQFKLRNGAIVTKIKKSLFCINHKNKVRIACVRLVESDEFHNAMMLIIVLNSISIACFDSSLQRPQLNDSLNKLGYVYTSIYAVEAALKIIANGFVLGTGTYLRSTVNIFDFFVVISSLSEVVMENLERTKNFAIVFRLLRSLRVMKLLFGFNKNKQMREQITTLTRALKGLGNVLIFLTLFFLLLAIIGLQLFSDDIYNACRLTPEPVEIDGKLVWERAPTDKVSPSGICSKSNSKIFVGGYQCPSGYTCGSYLDFGLPLSEDGVASNRYLYYDIAVWKNFLTSLIAVFQISTTDSWTTHLYNMINSTDFFLPVIFVFCVHMFGTFYIMQLTMVIIMESYIEADEIYALDDIEQQKKTIQLQIAQLGCKRYLKNQAEIQRILEKTQSNIVTLEWKQEDGLFYRVKEIDVIEENFEMSVQSMNRSRSMARADSFSGMSKQRSIAGADSYKRLPTVASPSPFLGEFYSRAITIVKDQGEDEEVIVLKPFEMRQIERLYNLISQEFAELKESTLRLQNQETKDLMCAFINKKIACAMLQQEQDLESGSIILKMEKDLLLMELKQFMKHQYNKERAAHYGLKNEYIVLKFIKSSIDGIFDDFTSKKGQKLNVHLGNVQKETFILRSIANDPRSVFHRIKRKKYLAFGHEVLLSLDLMFRLQDFIMTKLKSEQQLSLKAANDLLKVENVFKLMIDAENTQKAQERIKQRNIYQLCYEVDVNPWYQGFIALCILLNTIILGFDKYPTNLEQETLMEHLNLVFFFIFILEMIIKMLGIGPKKYFQDGFALFDFIVIVFSILEFTLELVNFKTQGLTAIRALKVFRLLRVFKLAKFWKSFHELLNVFFFTATKISYLSLILVLCLVMFAIIGKEIYAYKLSFDFNDSPLADDYDFEKGKFKRGYPPDFNFDTFFNSFTTAFLFIAQDSWSDIVYQISRVPGIPRLLTLVFFYSLYIVLRMVLYQFFLAILLKEFDKVNLQQKVAREIKELEAIEKAEATSRTSWWKPRWWFIFFKKAKVDINENPLQQKQTKAEPVETKDRVFYCFSPDNCLRKFFIGVINFTIRNVNVLDTIIWIAIALSSVMMAFDSPLTDKNSKFNVSLGWADFAMTVLFTIEVVVKVMASGLLFNGKQSYLRTSSNILDFFVVLASWAGLYIKNDNLRFVKILRMAKLARPLRLIFRNENLKISIKVLGYAIPQLLRLLFISVLIFMIFGVIGVKFFKGRLFYCKVDHIVGIQQEHSDLLIKDGFECLNLGGQWNKWDTNFDNVFSATLQIFIIAQTINWPATMLRVMKAQGINEAPLLHQPFGGMNISALFFIVWITFGCFFLLNLFAGVIISSYNRENERQGEKMLLTEKQRRKLETQLFNKKVKPLFIQKRPNGKCRSFVFDIVYTEDLMIEEKKKKIVFLKPGEKRKKEDDTGKVQLFDMFILVIIFLNTLILVVKWPNMSNNVNVFCEVINYICTVVFIIEAILKLIAFGKYYFKDTWNNFDFIIVVGSLAFLAPQFAKQKRTITMLRAFRIMRVFKLFKKFKQLKSIFNTVEYTMSAMVNILMLMMLIIYLFAIIGVYMFADIKLNPPLTDLNNFQSLPKAYLTLYMALARSKWNDIMEALSLEKSITNDCIDSPTYQDYVNNGHVTVGCGNRGAAVFFFTAYSIIVSIVFLSLFVAIILSGYFSTNQKTKKEVVKEQTDRFQRAWAIFDPYGSGSIDYDDFDKLMIKLGRPLGWDKMQALNEKLKNYFREVIALNMPNHKNDPDKKWYFDEVLDQLMFYFIVYKTVWKEIKVKGIKTDRTLTQMKRKKLY